MPWTLHKSLLPSPMLHLMRMDHQLKIFSTSLPHNIGHLGKPYHAKTSTSFANLLFKRWRMRNFWDYIMRSLHSSVKHIFCFDRMLVFACPPEGGLHGHLDGLCFSGKVNKAWGEGKNISIDQRSTMHSRSKKT